ncbi:hypothetical protein Thein_2233 [Thermodesulfatator indicus DSM 15286]|uniref:Uncharacterized protein n=1 Tax=Thermodesulfatator indicus (strain DSM 15286 / JCM 11887 / CIR29812) TaxID=667014 RepID=F8AE35_THEID|nr:hypothetical protein Thein_2233 [Thermodesulfatator indicus DSM 15286]
MAPEKENNQVLRIIHPICCGLDVHKRFVSACILKTLPDGSIEVEVREFETFTDDLIALREWLIEKDCPIVAMESTGVYWQPIHNILEGYVEVILVNARHIKNVPGRKTDVSDSRWLAELLRVGLLRASYIPPKQVRFWRELVRLRQKHVKTLADYKKRVQKLFESANIKLDNVVSDLFGETGRQIMRLLLETPKPSLEEVRVVLKGNLRKKVEELYRSICGFFEEHHRFLLHSLLSIIETLEKEIGIMDIRIKEVMRHHEDLIERLKGIPGVSEVSARAILAEVGPDLRSFPNERALASWAGVCPGNNESGGKRISGKSPVKKHPLRSVLIEVSWAATRKKGTYYAAKYRQLRARRGPKKAIGAIAHKILKAVYFIIKEGQEYRELGANHLKQINRERLLTKIKEEAERLGYKVVAA